MDRGLSDGETNSTSGPLFPRVKCKPPIVPFNDSPPAEQGDDDTLVPDMIAAVRRRASPGTGGKLLPILECTP